MPKYMKPNPLYSSLTFKGQPMAFNLKKEEEPSVSPKIVIEKLCFGCKKPVCEVCSECEQEGCILAGKCITSKQAMIAAGLAQARTQKANGFLRLTTKFNLRKPQPYAIITEDDDIQYADQFDAYIRPCPITPRHGFVESRRMQSTQENIRKIWEECKQADKEGELIICKAIDAKYNAIITPSMLAVGPGNAGATGGKDSVSIPLMGVLPPEIANVNELANAGVDISVHDPYLELVYCKYANAWFYTQLRAGAKVPKAPDYVPERIRVDRVLEASGDLMEWEKQVATITKGTVVYHLGGTLISHYGVHCITNNIPIYTTRIPTMGEVLEPIGEVVIHEPTQMIKGLALGAMIPLSSIDGDNVKCFNIRQMLPLMMTTLHNSPAMGNGWGVWVGFAVSIMIRAGMAASHGEARHAKGNTGTKYARTTIYETALKDFFGARSTLGHAQWAFLYDKWAEGSFGGKKWASCTESILLLDRAARALMQKPIDDNRVKVVNALNRAVNEAHNGGWWLNKFVTQGYFTSASNQSLRALERVATILIPVNNYFSSIEPEQWKAVAFKWANAGEIDIISQSGKAIPSKVDIKEEESEPSHPYIENWDKSLNDPNCCGDCWEKYHFKLKAKAAAAGLSPVPSEPQIIVKVSANPSKPKSIYPVGGAKKISFNSSGIVDKAHVRLDWNGSCIYNVHIQAKLKSGYYWSWDFYLAAGMSQQVNKVLVPLSLTYEGSYSSDAGGYLPMQVGKSNTEHAWVFIEPISQLEFKLTTQGDISCVIKETNDGQTEAKENKTEKELVSQ